MLEYTAIVAVVAIGISGYFGFLVGELGFDLPTWMLGAPGTGEGHVVDLFAVLMCILVAVLLNLGIRTAARVETSVVESKDAQRHMPRAIIYSLIISMVLYVLATLVLTGMQNYRDVDPESGFSTAFASVGLSGLASVIAGFLPIREAAELTNIGILLVFVVVCVAVIVLRYRQPDLPRTFRLPGMPVVPAVGVVFSIWLITFLAPATWLRFGIWFALGLLIYFAYSRHRSALATGSTSVKP